MTCHESELLLIDNPTAASEKLECHLAECSACRALREELAADQAALRELATEDGIPDSALTGLHSRVMANLPRRPTYWLYAAGAAAAAVVLAAVFFSATPGQPLPSPPAMPTVAAAKPPAFALTAAPKPAPPPILPFSHRDHDPSLMVKLETSDPNVVIYWMVENASTGELE